MLSRVVTLTLFLSSGAFACGAELDLSYVPPKAVTITVLGEAAIREPIFQALRALKTEDKETAKVEARLLAVWGARPEAIEQITLVNLPGETLIVRTRADHDFKKVAGFFAATNKKMVHAGKIYYQGVQQPVRYYYFPDDRTAVITRTELDLREVIEAGKSAKHDSWIEHWKTTRRSDLAGVLNLAAIRADAERRKAYQPLAQAMGPLWEKASAVLLSTHRQEGLRLEMVALCEGKEDATMILQVIEGMLAEARKRLTPLRQALAGDASVPAEARSLVQNVVELCEELLKEVQVKQEDKIVRLSASVRRDAAASMGAAWVLPALAKVRQAAP